MTDDQDIDQDELDNYYLQTSIQAQIDILNWVLENCSGGGNWRRKCEQKIAELESE